MQVLGNIGNFPALGQRLKRSRLARNESQKELATRLGISIPTLYKMEQGSPNVSIGLWAQTLWLFDRPDDLEQLFKPEESLFDQYQIHQKTKGRHRAGKNKS